MHEKLQPVVTRLTYLIDIYYRFLEAWRPVPGHPAERGRLRDNPVSGDQECVRIKALRNFATL
ncbi:hypothetical protein S101446_00582 [Komagataeibacter europaeus]|nr:hypothetical protein S101446_00582 [Komagataeibacter europaeus]